MPSTPPTGRSIEDVVLYTFRRPALIERALTHTSLRQTKSDPSYERLEFLGDRVLGLLIAELLLERFPQSSEGKLAPRLAALVSGRTLADVARSIGLGEFIRMSDGESAAGTRDRRSVLADCCEAVIGALYRDGGLDAAREFVKRLWMPLIDDVEPRVAKTELQEWLQARGLPLPEYVIVERVGPPHQPVFTVELTISGQAPVRAQGKSKRAAEVQAATLMLDSIREKS
ncbi:MAG: ribonuclease III [Rhodospirillaceae bacterium]